MKRNTLFLLCLLSSVATVQTAYLAKLSPKDQQEIKTFVDDALVKEIAQKQTTVTKGLKDIFGRVKVQQLLLSKNFTIDNSVIDREIGKRDENDIESIREALEISHKNLHSILRSLKRQPDLLATEQNQSYLKEAVQTMAINLMLINTIEAGITVVEKQKSWYFFTSTKNIVLYPALMLSLNQIKQKITAQKTQIQKLITSTQSFEGKEEASASTWDGIISAWGDAFARFNKN